MERVESPLGSGPSHLIEDEVLLVGRTRGDREGIWEVESLAFLTYGGEGRSQMALEHGYEKMLGSMCGYRLWEMA